MTIIRKSEWILRQMMTSSFNQILLKTLQKCILIKSAGNNCYKNKDGGTKLKINGLDQILNLTFKP